MQEPSRLRRRQIPRRLRQLDEPSEGLAPIVVKQMAAAIGEMKRAGLSVLLCEENAQFAQSLVDRSYRIEKGQVRAS